MNQKAYRAFTRRKTGYSKQTLIVTNWNSYIKIKVDFKQAILPGIKKGTLYYDKRVNQSRQHNNLTCISTNYRASKHIK